MKVVLLKNVENLGIVGDEKDVKVGYARNFLLPKKLVIKRDDPEAKKLIGELKKKREKVAEELNKIKDLADKINNTSVEIIAKAGEKDKLFGAITPDDIAKKLKIDKKAVDTRSIKSIGVHVVNLKFDYGISAKVNIIIKKEKSDKK